MEILGIGVLIPVSPGNAGVMSDLHNERSHKKAPASRRETGLNGAGSASEDMGGNHGLGENAARCRLLDQARRDAVHIRPGGIDTHHVVPVMGFVKVE